MKPSVAIITPTYNRLHTLPRVWASLTSQTESNFQWIVIDDGSTDNTAAWIKGLGDKRITYRHQKNQGWMIARNNGRPYVKADYVTYLDSDDELYKPTSLAEMVAEIKSAADDIGEVAFPVVDKQGKRLYGKLPQPKLMLDYATYACRPPVDYIRITRRHVDATNPYPPNFGEEVYRLLAIARQHKIMLVDKPTRIYHFATAGDEAADNLSTTTGFFTRLYDSFICLEEILTQHKGVWLANCPRIYGQNLFQFALMATMLGKTWTPITALIKAMWRGDWRVRVKSILLMPLLPLPLSLRRRLLLWRWRMVIAAQKRKPLP